MNTATMVAIDAPKTFCCGQVPVFSNLKENARTLARAQAHEPAESVAIITTNAFLTVPEASCKMEGQSAFRMERRVGSWSCNTATGEIVWSQELYEIFGASPESKPSLDAFFDFVNAAERAGLQRQLRDAVRDGRSCCLSYRVDLPDGPRSIEVTGSTLAHEYAGAVIEHLDTGLANESGEPSEIVGTSPPLRRVLACVAQVASTDSTVLITGETGTGKELIARAIHRGSPRATRAFISVNCAALSPSLISSELFGHEKGSFTGAMQRRLGRFELADGGTIFLDEVGDLPPDTQIALPRVLQEREFERLGGSQTLRVDVRVIAATNRDLVSAAAAGRGAASNFGYR
ncbi:MAG TPA: sigma 54-interacting transcriptional regulator [Acidobacteriaceae bacterium]|nr:sigma 54-interacting transcriptional regulator [Acidobacteriaceae bacterium]